MHLLGYIFSDEIIIFPLCNAEGGKRVIKFVFIFVFDSSLPTVVDLSNLIYCILDLVYAFK